MPPSQPSEEANAPSVVASTIPRISDITAYRENMAAIDQVIRTKKYHHVIAWGKWLGFTPETIKKIIEVAQRDDAPADAIQKVDGRWLRLRGIKNEFNRKCVNELAQVHHATEFSDCDRPPRS
ncbi:MAG: hypothetical protein V4719_27205 [Planctomycetota bacterium]